MKKIIRLLLIGVVFLTASCSRFGAGTEYNEFEGTSANDLYKEAKKAHASEQYVVAIKKYEALETMYPFNENAEQAGLDLIYAYYQNGDYPAAAAMSERYIHLYPRAKNVDYAYYMKGLANFQQNRGALTNVFPFDESWRDPGSQFHAYSDFATLIERFPESRYNANALQRMTYLRNMFAKKELNVAEYYFERKMYIAAVERANYLIKTYPQASSVQKALTLLYNANMELGLPAAAEEAMIVYRATYHKEPDRIVLG